MSQATFTTIEADAIVNAANSAPEAGGGVCGAIFRPAGFYPLTRACRVIGHCPAGEAVITPAFGIKTARAIIHAVGPTVDEVKAGTLSAAAIARTYIGCLSSDPIRWQPCADYGQKSEPGKGMMQAGDKGPLQKSAPGKVRSGFPKGRTTID